MAIHSPPATENNEQFVALAQVFRDHHVPVPHIHGFDATAGFFVVDDLGSVEFLDVYQDEVQRVVVIRLALEALVQIQQVRSAQVPPYLQQRLLDELHIFAEWCCEKTLETNADPMERIADELTAEIDRQPKVTIHRDFHSRNLLLDDDRLGIVDFQDALVGSSVYDLASLLYDCYFEHKQAHIDHWIDHFRTLALLADLPMLEHRSAFVRALEIVALQRMLKAVGIFCRLWLSQHKRSHLPYVVPVITRVIKLANRNGFSELGDWLDTYIKPRLLDVLKN